MTAKSRPFLFGILILFAARAAVKLFGLVNYIILINIKEFGDRGIGLYSAGFTIYMVLLAISTMGIPAAIAKMVSEKIALGQRYEAHKIFKVTFYFLLVVGALFTAILIASSGIISRAVKIPAAEYSIIALAPTIFFAALMSSYRGYFQGMQDMVPQAVSETIEQIFKLIFSVAFVVVLLPYGLEWAAAGATFGTTAGAVCGTIYLFILYKIKMNRGMFPRPAKNEKDSVPADRWNIIKNLLKLSVPISMGAIILTISSVIDLATVADRLIYAGFGARAEELYGQLAGKCQQLVNFPVALNMAIATAIIPAIAAAMAVNDIETVKQKISSALRLTMMIGLPSAAGMSVLADPILKLIYPNQSGGAEILQVLAYSIIFMAVSQSLAGVLQGMGKVNITAISLLAGAAVKLAVNFTLVPIHSINIVGAAYGSIACYMVSSGINFFVFRKNVEWKPDIANIFIKPAFATLIMAVTAIYQYKYLFMITQNNAISVLFTIITAVMVFMISLILTRAVSYDDFKMLPAGDKIGSFLIKIKLLRR